MPVGIIAGATAVAGIGSAVIGAGATKSAAKSAAKTSDAAAQTQLQLGQQSLGLNRDIYNANYGTLGPYVSRGNVAGDSINALLGLPSAPVMQSPLGGTALGSGTLPAPGTSGGFQTAPVVSQTPVGGQLGSASRQIAANGFLGQSPAERVARMGGEPMGLPTSGPNALGNGLNLTAGRSFQQAFGGGPAQGAVGVSPAAQAPASTPMNALTASDAFNNFANSAGMQFQLQQGTNALNNLYAAKGMLQSGAAMKGIQNYGQQTALNNYFLPYMGLLGGQQAVGAGAASSIAGVGANFGNTAANINSQMAGNIGANASNQANAQLASGAANANMWGNIGSSVGNALGGFGSSYMHGGSGTGGGAINVTPNYTNYFSQYGG